MMQWSAHTRGVSSRPRLITLAMALLATAGCGSEEDTHETIAGSVVLTQQHSTLDFFREGVVVSGLVASFPRDPAAAAASDTTARCTEDRFGPCAVRRCLPSTSILTPPTPHPIFQRDVGALRVEGLRVDLGEIFYSDGVGHVSPPAPRRLWLGNERVTIRATGATGGVAAFSTTIRAPGLIEVFAPRTDATIARREPLDMAWSAQDDTTLRVTLISDAYPPRTIACEFDGGAGAGAIPREAMSAIQPAEYARLQIISERHRLVPAGEDTVAVSLVDVLPMISFQLH